MRMIRKAEWLLLALAACGTDGDSTPPRTLLFGPWVQAAGSEDIDLCVAATLHNDQPIYVNSVEMLAGPGLHHSNWMWVPDNGAFDFPEGSFSCAQGDGSHPFDQQIAAVFGGVLFAQSTQATHELQEFPAGAAIEIPPHSRVVADIHLVNSGDAPLVIPLALTLHPIPKREVTTIMAAMALENFSIAIPPQQTSKFVVECDLSQQWQTAYANGLVSSPTIDFKIYHALAHYHNLGIGLTFEALRDSDGGADTVWSTDQTIGGELGGMIAPEFDMTGHSKVRLTCAYDNPGTKTITWGNATGEMCVAFAYTDSTAVWTAGVIDFVAPGPSVVDNGVRTFTAPQCTVISADNTH
jgi:hypothetical protein